jgi:hypothetical protein
MASDSLFTGSAGLEAFHTEGDAPEQADVSSASECTKMILAERFGQANSSGAAPQAHCPMSVIELKE